MDEKGGKFPKKVFIEKDIVGDLDRRTGIRAKELALGRHNDVGWWGDFEYLESNMIDKHANDDCGILRPNMHCEDI